MMSRWLRAISEMVYHLRDIAFIIGLGVWCWSYGCGVSLATYAEG